MMMNKIRKNVENPIVKVFLGLLALSFVGWGVGDFVTGRSNTTAIEVGDGRVSLYDLQRRYDLQKRLMQQQMGGGLTPEILDMMNLDKQVYNSVIQEQLMNNYAAEQNLVAPQASVHAAIKVQPSFQNSEGKFDPEVYKNTLFNAGFTEQRYEKSIGGDLLRNQLRQPFEDARFVDTQSVKHLLNYMNETRDVRAMVLTGKDLPPLPKPEKDDLMALYEQDKERYMTDEYRAFDMLVLDLNKMMEKVQVTEADARTRYEETKALYSTPEQRKVSHILVETQEEALDLLARLNDGIAFEELAKTHSQDPLSTDKGGNLGWFTKGGLPSDELDALAFDTQPGKVAGPVETSFGFHIIKVTGIQEPDTKTFAEVKNRVINEIKYEAAEDDFYDRLESVQDAIAGTGSLEQAAIAAETSLQSFTFLNQEGQTRNGQSVSLPKKETVLETVFTLPEDEISRELNFSDAKIGFVQTTDVTPARQQSFEAVKNKLAARWRDTQTKELLAEKARVILKSRRDGATFEGLARRHNVSSPLQTVVDVRRDGPTKADIINDASRNVVFKTPLGEAAKKPVMLSDNKVILYEVTGINVEEPAEQAVANVKRYMSRQIRGDLFSQMVNHLMSQTKIHTNNQMVARAFGQETQ